MPGIELATLNAGPYILCPPATVEAADALAMLEDRDVRQWNPAPLVVDLESAADWCRRGGDWTSGRHATWSIRWRRGDGPATGPRPDAREDRLLGNISLFDIDAGDQMMASIGYRTAPWARNRGVAALGVIAASRWAFEVLGIERLELQHAVKNPASCRVAENAGFALEGTLRDAYRDLAGSRWDCHAHSRLAIDPDLGRAA